MAYIINTQSCVGCSFCKFLCYFDAITTDDDGKTFRIIEEKCRSCGQCFDGCINSAIVPDSTHKQIKKVTINDQTCIGCSLCSRFCPVKAISGVIKSPFIIDQDKCIRCGLCSEKCKKGAVLIDF